MLSVQNLCVGYGRRLVVREFSARPLQPGSLTALLGPNGSGKSTLLKGLVGLARVSSGTAQLDGMDLLTAPACRRAREVGYLPQNSASGGRLRVIESLLVAAGAGKEGRGYTADAKQVDEAVALLAYLEIHHLALHYLDELSGGQQQLVAVAQALIREPKVLLLDEPFAALDLNYQFHLLNVLRTETRQRALVTVIVMHDMNTALRELDHAWLMHEGRLVAEGKPAEVITPRNLATAFGVRGRVEAAPSDTPHVLVEGLQGPIE